MPDRVLPDYGGRCLTEVVPALLRRRDAGPPDLLPEPLWGADQVVLLVLDGLGWEQLQERRELAPTLAGMDGGPITTVAPSTTSTALTSLTTGAVPLAHGVMGYRMRVGVDGGEEVLNVLRWSTASGDARVRVPPESVQPLEPFLGVKPAVVTRSDFGDSGFTRAHLAGSELHGWRYPSTLVARTAGLLRDGCPFVYAYYPGVDTVAHEFGFGELYDAELAAADRLVGDLLTVLPAGAALAVVADHGQVQVGERLVSIDREVLGLTTMLSGEGRFRWLHAAPGLATRLLEVATERHADVGWVLGVEDVLAGGWLGPPGTVTAPAARTALGDVALVASTSIAFLDPADTGSYELQCRHGSLTAEEMLVPLLAARR
jgi:predicted AlkP superfamily pyrophosphatase or phosphodiesterase